LFSGNIQEVQMKKKPTNRAEKEHKESTKKAQRISKNLKESPNKSHEAQS